MTNPALEALTLQFLAVESITGNEAAYAELVETTLRERGYEVQRQPVESSRFNVVANAGAPVLFCTHLDTVPPFLPPSQDAENIYGRGACDTKGILAAMLGATDRLRADGIDDVGFLLTVGEEVDGAGAMVANQTLRSRYVVVGEPTENCLARGHKGLLKFSLRSTGITGHSAYPETGHSAIHELVRVLARLLDEDWGHDDVLGPGTFNAGRIVGGHAANVIADAAHVDCMVRTVGPAEPVQRRVEASLDDRTLVEWIKAESPSELATLPGFETCVVSFSTDVPYLPDVGTPLLYGPGSIRDAHTAHERIEKASLHRAVDDYVAIARQLLDRA